MSDKFQIGLDFILTTPVKDVAEVLNLLQDLLRLLVALYTHVRYVYIINIIYNITRTPLLVG
jgi:hypothetical protein